MEGKDTIREMVRIADGHLQIMAGGGVTGSVSWFSIREWKKFMEVVVEAVWMWELARDYVCSAMKYRKQGVFMGGEKVELIETINI